MPSLLAAAGTMQQPRGTSLKRPACTARSARCLKRTQGAKDCTASNTAIRRLWAWRVSHIALSGWSTSPPHGPTDPWTRANTAQPTCRLRVRGPGTAQHCTRTPRACGSQDATPAPLLDAHSGTRAMARGAVSADPRGSCHQPRRYHVSPAKWLRRPILRGGTRHAVTQRALSFSLYKMHSL